MKRSGGHERLLGPAGQWGGGRRHPVGACEPRRRRPSRCTPSTTASCRASSARMPPCATRQVTERRPRGRRSTLVSGWVPRLPCRVDARGSPTGVASRWASRGAGWLWRWQGFHGRSPRSRHHRANVGRFVARVDWLVAGPEVVIEFDGKVKYGSGDPSVLWTEKRREDALRAHWVTSSSASPGSDLEVPGAVAAKVRAALTLAT